VFESRTDHDAFVPQSLEIAMHIINWVPPSFVAGGLCVAACLGQTFHISGVVTDSAGAGIEGAAVKLEKANIAATSAADGSFTLAGEPASSMRPIQAHLSGGIRPVVSNGGIRLHLDSPSHVEIAAYSLRGRMLFSLKETMGAGTHSFAMPIMGSGIHLYRLAIGNTEYSLKTMLSGHVPGTPSTQEQKRRHGALEKGAKASEAIEDVIAVSKDGYLIYRVTVTNSDTSGIEIEMVPSAGTVTDSDGNVYQTVRIGSQVWTAENLRTTKFTNGEPIPEVQDHSAWAKRTSPAYCYYKNTRDADTINRYGGLYNYYTVVYAGKLAPTGWHVPSNAEWNSLQNYLVVNGYELTVDNRTGFTPLRAGMRGGLDGLFCCHADTYTAGNGWWWTGTELDASYAWRRILNYDIDLPANTSDKRSGYSVRLVKD